MTHWRPRSRCEQAKAIGFEPRNGKLDYQSEYARGPGMVAAFQACKCCFDPDPAAWENIEAPEEGEWLASHNTPDQGFLDYVRSSPGPNRPNQSRHTIFLLPLCRPTVLDSTGEEAVVGRKGSFPSLAALEAAVAAFYQMPVQQLPPIPMESLKFQTAALPVREDRGFGPQWNAHEVLQALRARVPRNAFCVLAITMEDLFPRPEWNFVYGLGDLANRVGVFSFVRHDPCSGKRERDPLEESWLLWRSMATTLHEIGHMFGVKHCTWFNCLMRGNNGDGVEHQRSPLEPCPVCLRKLHWNIGFDIVRRYEELLNIYETHASACEGFAQVVGFIKQRLTKLEGLPSTELPQRQAWAAKGSESNAEKTAENSRESGHNFRPQMRQPTAGISSASSGARARSANQSRRGSTSQKTEVVKPQRRRSNPEDTRAPIDDEALKWQAAIKAIYVANAPHQLSKLDGYLARYKGNEERLYELVCKTYGTLPEQM